jgi:predicted ATPase
LLQLLKIFETEGLQHEFRAEESSVVQVLDTRTENLPAKVKDGLKVAACLGCVFSEACLVSGVLLPESDILSAIRRSEIEGIIVRVDTHTFRFSHDKFQHAIYALVPEKNRDAFHLAVGLRLWHWLSSDLREEHLLLIGDLISRAIYMVKDKEERDDLANLFLLAGKKAAKASSFSSAAAYLKCGIALLNSGHWRKQYKLSLKLYNTAAEIEYYCGNFDRVDQLVAKTLHGAQSFDDSLVARFTRIYSLGSRCEMMQALNESFEVLKLLGEPLPCRLGSFRTFGELETCKRLLRGQSDQTLCDSPVLKDTKKCAALRLMNIMHTFAFNRGHEYGPIIAARAVRMSLQHGINEHSTFVSYYLS